MTNQKAEEPLLYLRIRNKNETFHLDFHANHTILDVKAEINTIYQQHKIENLRLFQKVEGKFEPFLEENKILKNLQINEDNAQAHKVEGGAKVEAQKPGFRLENVFLPETGSFAPHFYLSFLPQTFRNVALDPKRRRRRF